MERNESDLGWVAGILDGEGTIALNKGKNSQVRKGFVWSLKLTIDNTSQVMLDRVLSVIGFGRVRPLRAATNRWKALYRYELLTYSDLLNFLRLIKPGLTAKRTQAEYLIEALELLLEVKAARTNPKRGEIRDRRIETLWRLMRVLNAKSKNRSDAIKLLEASPLYTREQYEADMKAFQDSYHPRSKDLVHNRERLRQWRLLNPEKYKAQLDRASENRRAKGKKPLEGRYLIQDAAAHLTDLA